MPNRIDRPHDIVGVEQGASRKAIQAAYRSKSIKHHPDANGDKWAFQMLNEAYEQLIATLVKIRCPKCGNIEERPAGESFECDECNVKLRAPGPTDKPRKKKTATDTKTNSKADAPTDSRQQPRNPTNEESHCPEPEISTSIPPVTVHRTNLAQRYRNKRRKQRSPFLTLVGVLIQLVAGAVAAAAVASKVLEYFDIPLFQ